MKKIILCLTALSLLSGCYSESPQEARQPGIHNTTYNPDQHSTKDERPAGDNQ